MVRARATQRFDESGDAWEVDLFADRVSEAEAFAAALEAHRRRLDDEIGEEDDTRGRNVLVFHGRGGLGKTALSGRLEKWIGGSASERDHWGSPPPITVAATARVDLHTSHGHIDAAAQLARIRIALTGIQSRFPLFDVAFAAYWAATHPGEALPDLEVEGDTEIAPTVIEILGAATEDFEGPSTLAAITVQALRELFGSVTIHLRRRLRIETPPGYERLFERCTVEPTPDTPSSELVAELAMLLAYELDAIEGPVPLVVVFIDTFERLSLDERRAGEQVLNRVVAAMSNVLFVITGRDRLTWWEIEGPALPFRGPGRWPLLVPGAIGEPRQHALEHLSTNDRELLTRLLWDRHGLPEVPDEEGDLLVAISEASNGLPEYIRLAVHAASNAFAQGEPVTRSLVTGSFDDLVLRLLEHTDADEQSAIRAAALLHAADPALIAATADVSVGAAERAVRGALFTLRGDGEDMVPALHDEVRRAIRQASNRMRGGWADADWDLAGTRALAELRGRYVTLRESYRKATAVGPRTAAPVGRSLLKLTAHAIAILCETRPDIGAATLPASPDWVAEAMTHSPSYIGLRPFLPAVSQTERGADTLDFLLAKSTEVPEKQRWQILRRISSERGPLWRIAARHLAYGLRDRGDWGEAMRIFDELLLDDPDSVLLRRQRVVTLIHGRRLIEAWDAIPATAARSHDSLRGHVMRVHGAVDDYLDSVDRRLARVRSSATNAVKDVIELEGIRIRHAALVGRVGEEDVAAIAVLADAAGHEGARRDCLLAAVLIADHSIEAHHESIDALITELVTADRVRGGEEIAYRSAWARVAVAYARGDQEAMIALLEQISARTEPRSAQWVAIEMCLEISGLSLQEPPTAWREPRDLVVGRWREIWESWRERALKGSRP